MICRLKSYDTVIPGGYLFEDLSSVSRKFPATPSIEALAQDVASYREANKIARSSYAECLQDVDRYNAQRIGCNALWCVPVDPEVIQSEARARHKSCGGCGAVLHT